MEPPPGDQNHKAASKGQLTKKSHKPEDFWHVFLIVLAAALIWIVINVFWGHNEHRRNIDLGIHQRAPASSRGDRFSDADAVATREASFHRAGLALSLWPSAGKILSLHLWLRFAVLWFAVVLIGFVEGAHRH